MKQQNLFSMDQMETKNHPVEFRAALMPELLFHPNIPKPLHGINPRTIKGKGWWDRVRRAAYAERDYTCWSCGVHKSQAKYHQWLEGHEIYDFDYETGAVTFKRLCALCHSCHNYIHDGRMQMLVRAHRMTSEKMEDILQHGQRVLRSAGYTRYYPDMPNVVDVPWGQWHMIIDGVKYYSCFSGYEEWMEYYSVYNGKGKIVPRLEPFTATDECTGAVFAIQTTHVVPESPRICSNGNLGELTNQLNRIAAKHGHDMPYDF